MRTLHMPAAAHWWARLLEHNAAPKARRAPVETNAIQAVIRKYAALCPDPTSLLGPAGGARPESERILGLEVDAPSLVE